MIDGTLAILPDYQLIYAKRHCTVLDSQSSPLTDLRPCTNMKRTIAIQLSGVFHNDISLSILIADFHISNIYSTAFDIQHAAAKVANNAPHVIYCWYSQVPPLFHD